MHRIRLVTFAGLLGMVPGIANAQNITSPYDYLETRHEVGLWGGYLESNTGSLDLGPAPSPVFGARYGIHLTGPLYGEVDLGVAPSQRTVYARTSDDPGAALTPLGSVDAVILLAEAGFRFQLTGPRTWHRLAPYLLAGAGIATNLTPGGGRESVLTQDQIFRFGPAFAAEAGLGTQFFLADWLSIRGDFRDHLWRLSKPIGLTGATERENEWTHNFTLTIGSAIHF